MVWQICHWMFLYADTSRRKQGICDVVHVPKAYARDVHKLPGVITPLHLWGEANGEVHVHGAQFRVGEFPKIENRELLHEA